MTNVYQATIDFLSSAQQADGSFIGLASSSATAFSAAKRHPTTFFTSLILACLQDIPEADDIRAKAAGFLLARRSPEWSWNYWVRGKAAARFRSYPDDLDDTMCALIGLYQEDRTLLGGEAMAYVGRQLISCEAAVGGPYRTWLVDKTADPIWRDVDLAVNANIGYLLSLHGVAVPGLEAYIGRQLQADALLSPYYVGTIPSLYFMARWYKGDQLQKLIDLVSGALEATVLSKADHPLRLALLISASCQLQHDSELLTKAVERLRHCRKHDRWAAEALYYEPPLDGQLQYAGSSPLTTAFALEALCKYDKFRARADQSAQPNVIVQQALQTTDSLESPLLRQCFTRAVTDLTENQATIDHITTIANITNQACGNQAAAWQQRHLNLGSLYGWVAYTIYDDFLDDEAQPILLGSAHCAARLMQRHFRQALPTQNGWDNFVEMSLQVVDAANSWEIQSARKKITKGVLALNNLPAYDDLHHLAERSWGHVIAPTGILLANGYDWRGPEITDFQNFFKHFLIARQLNDDAHDWEDDLLHGRISVVVNLLLAADNRGRSTDINLLEALPTLRLRFWQQTIDTVVGLINDHVLAGRKILSEADFINNPAPFEQWLNDLENSARRTLTERQQANKFMKIFENSGAPKQ